MKNLTLSLLLSSLLGFSLIAFAGEDKATEDGNIKEVKEADRAKKEDDSKEETSNKDDAADESADTKKETTGEEGEEGKKKGEEEPDCE